MTEKQLLLDLISAGIQASSPDNSQPWKFKLADNSIELRLNPDYLGMFFDTDGYASLLGCGGVIENIRLLAAEKGYGIEVQHFEVTEPEFRVARISLISEGAVKEPALAQTINRRCTHRGFFYQQQEISSEVLSDIERVLNDIPDARVHWFDGSQREQVTKIISDADRIRYTHKALHHDFYVKLRTGKEIEKQKDGLAADTLGLENMFTLTLPMLKSWTFANLLNYVGMQYFMAFRGATIPLKNAAKIGALVMPRNADVLLKGKALQRLWLGINAIENLHFQPFGAFPLFIYRMKEAKGEGFSDKEQKFLQKNIDALDALIGNEDDSDSVVILFRIGYAPEPKAYARRRPLEKFLIE